MARDNFGSLLGFIAVVREGSFTRAAAQLGLSQSALSHNVKALEEKLGVRLLTRTTRNVSPTEAGQRLFDSIAPQFEEIDAQLLALTELRDKPKGAVRVTASDYAIRSVIWPRLGPFLRQYPDIKVELVSDYRLADISEQRFDAGVRFGEQLAQDMIAVRIGPDVRFAVVATPEYLAGRAGPVTPQDLSEHTCINLRLPTYGGLWAWEFEKDGRELKVRVDGQLVLNGIYEVLDGALGGLGLAYVPEDIAADALADGRLVRLLEDWCPYWSGYHLYYPSRRQPSKAMSLLIDALRHGG
ncbi:LysR family transcriptional regulator [Pseudomonas citronellolis]|uniref:LysR family transcriptional regulator n=1 Tax=Pseudomonas citronellolis TaxID=53408 RepID=UPI0021BE5127|nr:LysR family transcriptional regulator [Pseudomonas citronellolis]UXJ53529.1 LysR family transcriptional regulator [Pseudomonas citronellolis]